MRAAIMDEQKFSTHDVSKRAMTIPQIMLDGVNLWPKRRNIWTKLAFWVMLVLLVIIETGHLIYFVLNISDLAKMASTMSTLSTTFQAITKLSILFIYSDEIDAIIDVIRYDFWPSSLTGTQTEDHLKKQTYLVVSSMCMVYITAVLFAFGFLSLPLREGSLVLPFASWYPFNWQTMPLYEIIYVVQWVTNIYVVITSICGHDNMFLASVSNCIAQFKLLKELLKKIGAGDNSDILYTLAELSGDVDELRMKRRSQDKELLVRCVKHHNKLIWVCDTLGSVFTASLFVQLLASVTAICVSSFLITMGNVEKSQVSHLSSYCLGHVLQLYLFCAAANELTYQSTSVSRDAFQSEWYRKPEPDVQKGLILLISRSHIGNKITALGVVNLNYETFVAGRL